MEHPISDHVARLEEFFKGKERTASVDDGSRDDNIFEEH